MPTTKVMTAVSAVVPADQEAVLLEGYRTLIAGAMPEGLLRSALLRGQDGAWHIQTLWRDREAIVSARRSGEPPAALRLLEGVGAVHTHDVLSVEEQYGD